jgi:putative transposase
MQRTNIIQLKPSKKQKKILRECMLLSSCVYNMANYITRQAFFSKEKIVNFIGLRQALQHKEDYQLLGRSYALPRIQIYTETNSARFKLIKSKTQKKVGLPKYLKNRKTNTTIPSYLVVDGEAYQLSKNKVRIPLSRQMRKKYGIKHFKIIYNGILKWQGKQQRGQIHEQDGKFYLHQSVEVADPKPSRQKNIAGIDLGIKRLLSISCSNRQDNLIGSNRFLKQWRYLTNLIAEAQASLPNKKYISKRIKRLYSMRSKWQNNLFNNIALKTAKILKKNQVSHCFIGDIKGIREDADFGKKGNSMLHNYWAYDKLSKKIANKCEQFRITFEAIPENYTSQDCPICGERQKAKDRIYVCSFCGLIEHRDIVGSKNILQRGRHSRESVLQGETALLRGGSHATA